MIDGGGRTHGGGNGGTVAILRLYLRELRFPGSGWCMRKRQDCGCGITAIATTKTAFATAGFIEDEEWTSQKIPETSAAAERNRRTT